VRNPNGGPFVEKSDLLVDFFVVNAGGQTVTGDYFIDLYLDGVIALRYSGIDIAPNNFVSIEGGTGLLDNFNLEPGEHEVELVIDPTNLIAEASDGDNSFSTTFTWAGPAVPAPLPNDRLPNLSIVGGTTGIIAAPYPGGSTSGGLSTKGNTFLALSVLNDSPITIGDLFTLSVLFDDVLVYNAQYMGMVGGSYINLDWEELASNIRITPGEHTVKLIADPGGAVTESNESDNTLEVTLVWGTDDPIPAPAVPTSSGAPIRAVQVLPDLTGATPYGWDAAIVASNAADNLAAGIDGPVWASQDTLISLSMRNASRVNSAQSGSFKTEIYIDDVLIDTALFESGEDAGNFWIESVTIPAGDLAPGQHLLKIVVDSDNQITETNEADNSLARWFDFQPGARSGDTPATFELSDAELAELLAPLKTLAFADQVRETIGSGVDLPDWTSDIHNAGRAGYYLLTGRDLDAERVVVHLLPHDQFIAASFNACMTDFFLLSDPTYIANYAACTDFGGELGFKFRLNGKVHVYVDLAESPIKALGVYFHELGHALQDLENPAQTDSANTQTVRGLFEAQAQVFEAAALRTIDNYLGINLMRFPDIPAMRNEAQFILDNNKAMIGSPEHVLGHTMLWHEVLADTSGLNLDDELRTNKRLSGSSAKKLYDYLVSLAPADFEAWRTIIFSDASRADEFVTISLSRLEASLPTADYGHPTLREPAFLVP
jgi:hypothetical protein